MKTFIIFIINFYSYIIIIMEINQGNQYIHMSFQNFSISSWINPEGIKAT